jgi:hypothetical protein
MKPPERRELHRVGHYEWQISFPPLDIDMGAIQAKVEPNGHLYIDVRRLTPQISFPFRH